MNTTMTHTTQDTREQLTFSPEQAFTRTLPAAPFPRKYVHAVFENAQDALRAALTLAAAGYATRDIHILTGQEYVEAIEQRHTFMSFLSSSDLDGYMQEARRGGMILAVRIPGYEQMRQVRDLLAPRGARLMKYVDTWTVAHLI